MIVVDLRTERIVKTIELARGAMPQDVKLSPDGRTFYVADMALNGVWLIDARTLRVKRFELTGAGAHGLYPSRNAKVLYVSNRMEGSISVLSFATRRPIAKWWLPGGGSPDMGGPVGRRQGAVAVRPLQRRGVRDLHRHRAPAAPHQGRRRPARPLRVAPAGPLLDRPHRHPALARRASVAGRACRREAGSSARSAPPSGRPAATCPPWPAIARTIASPRPGPPEARSRAASVRWKRSKTARCRSIPGRRLHQNGCALGSARRACAPPHARRCVSIALPTRLRSAWARRSGSARKAPPAPRRARSDGGRAGSSHPTAPRRTRADRSARSAGTASARSSPAAADRRPGG